MTTMNNCRLASSGYESPQYFNNCQRKAITNYFQDVIGPQIANIAEHITQVFKCPNAQNQSGMAG